MLETEEDQGENHDADQTNENAIGDADDVPDDDDVVVVGVVVLVVVVMIVVMVTVLIIVFFLAICLVFCKYQQ